MDIKATVYPSAKVSYNKEEQVLTIEAGHNDNFKLKVHPTVLREIVESIDEDLNQKEND